MRNHADDLSDRRPVFSYTRIRIAVSILLVYGCSFFLPISRMNGDPYRWDALGYVAFLAVFHGCPHALIGWGPNSLLWGGIGCFLVRKNMAARFLGIIALLWAIGDGLFLMGSGCCSGEVHLGPGFLTWWASIAMLVAASWFDG
jgi:hypothetical protein